MALYLEIGVVRIQEYICRTSGSDESPLRLRRGASRMVSQATQPNNFGQLGLQRNPETYDVDGVAHLFTSDPELDGKQLAVDCLHHLRESIPAAHLKASWCRVETYSEAMQQLRDSRDAAEGNSKDLGTISWLPPQADDALAKRCQTCAQGVAVSHEKVGGELNWLCQDCSKRNQYGTDTKNKSHSEKQTESAASPEDLAIHRIGKSIKPTLSRVANLQDLARLAPARGAKRNHLATIYADGNSVGALFEALTEPDKAQQASKILDNCVIQAVDQPFIEFISSHTNALTTEDGDLTLPGVLTTLGGDDVLLTVPASHGWWFAQSILSRFNDSARQKFQELDAGLTPPTLTAGLIFSHAKYPAEDVIGLASSAMRRAKALDGGGVSSIGWLDLTTDASSPHAECLTLSELATLSPLLGKIRATPNNQLQNIARLIRSAAQPDEVGLRDQLEEELARLGSQELLPESNSPTELLTLIGLANWWFMPEGEGS